MKEVSVKPHPGRTAQIEITRQQMGPGMPETGSESWNIHAGCLSSHIACLLFLREKERVLLSFGGKLFEALSRGSGGMLLNKHLGFRCSEIVCDGI